MTRPVHTFVNALTACLAVLSLAGCATQAQPTPAVQDRTAAPVPAPTPAPASIPAPAKTPEATPAASAAANEWPGDVLQFGQEVAAREKLDPNWVRSVLEQAVYLPEIRPLMVPSTAPGVRNWRAYRARFVDPIRINAGVRFWQRNRDALERAQAQFGVPPQVVVAIIGVETVYGRNMGNFRVLDTLSTLAFDFPRRHPRAAAREAYFRNELAQFLVLCARTGLDPTEAVGSYAGAMGMPQFMPSNWLRYAVDFAGDGHVDLWATDADAIGSVANYLKGHGWQPGEPTHFNVTLARGADLDALLAPDIKPTFSVAQFQALGANLGVAAQGYAGPLALIELPNGNPNRPGNTPSYTAGTQNFYVITRYNHSAFYAMSVVDLGEQIAKALHRAEQTTSQSTQ